MELLTQGLFTEIRYTTVADMCTEKVNDTIAIVCAYRYGKTYEKRGYLYVFNEHSDEIIRIRLKDGFTEVWFERAKRWATSRRYNRVGEGILFLRAGGFYYHSEHPFDRYCLESGFMLEANKEWGQSFDVHEDVTDEDLR